jgi:large subunit ribosomal protein L23
MFNVKPVACNVAWVKSKKKTSRTKSGFREGEKAAWKKAIVTLSPGEKIDIFEGV